MMEDQGIGDICNGNPPLCNGSNTPYMSSLANIYGIAQRYTSLINTSEPDYYGILEASLPANCSKTNTAACYPPAGSLTNLNLVDRFEAVGLTWRGYMENQNIVAGCDLGTHKPYTHEHNGFVAFQDITNNTSRCNKIVLANPGGCGGVTDCALVNDLNSSSAPNFMWLTPNLCNDMHSDSSCTSNGCTSDYSPTCLRDGDNYLKSLVPNILNSQTFTTTRAALFIVFDEGTGYCPLNSSHEDCVYAVWAGPIVKASLSSSRLYNHYSLTKTIEVNWNLPSLTSNDANAIPMTEFFKAPSPDFSLTATPSTVTFKSGETGSFNATVSAQNSFAGTVNLSTSTSPSTGLTVSCTPGSISGGSGSSICILTSSSPANYTVTITGTSSSLSHTTSISVSVTQPSSPDFTISTSPGSVTANVGATATSSITVAPLNGFTGTVALVTTTNSTNLACTLSSSSIPGGSGTSTLSCHGSPADNYLATITGTSGTLSHSASVTYHTGDFAISANPTGASVNVNVAGSSTITIAPLNAFSATVTLAVSTNSTNLSCILTPTSIASGSGSSSLSCIGQSAGNYMAIVTGSNSTLSHSTSVVYHVTNAPTFSVTADPTSVTANSGVAGASTIIVSPQNGFTGTVTLSITTNSTGLSCSLSATTISGGSGSSTLSCTGSAAANYLAIVIGTSGALSSQTRVTYHVTPAPDFSLSASPTSLSILQGSSGKSTITVTSLNSFTGTVTIAASVSPTGPTTSLSPSTITLTSNGAGSSTLNVTSANAATGTFRVNVTATSGTLSHSIIVTVTITSATGSSYALVVSYEGYVYKLYSNKTMVRIAHPVTTQLRAVTWKPDGSYALIIGDAAVLIKYDGNTFTTIPTGFSSAVNFLSIAWRPDGSYALIGGSGGALLRYDGTTVAPVSNPYTAYYRAISWNPSGTQALLVAYFGGIYMYQSNGQVAQLTSPTSNDLSAVAWNPNGSYALIAGSGGTILRYDGTSFQTLNTAGVYSSTLIVRYISFNPTGSLALLVGDSGLVLTYDGTSLSALPATTSAVLYSVSWSNGTAYIVGGLGIILSYSGGALSTVPSGFNSGFRGIAWKPN